MNETYRFASGVRGMFTFAAVLFAVLVVTIPVAIYFFVKSRSAKLVFDERGFTASGLGLTQRWEFAEIERLGTLTVEVVGGGPLTKLNGGAHAVNLVARTKRGKTLKFMLSRFERWEEVLNRVQAATQRSVEPVRPGLVGIAWPET